MLITRQALDITLTVMYGLLFIGCLFVPIDLYRTLTEALPTVGPVLKPYFVWITIIAEVIVFSRMVFISITDVADVSRITHHSDESLHWPGLILGNVLTETLGVLGSLTLIGLIWKVESLVDAFFIHGSKLL